MGIFKAFTGSAKGVFEDQWKEFFYCEAIPSEFIGIRGRKRISARSANTKSDDNVITDGSIVAVADGQIAIAVERGRAFACWAEPGEHVFRSSASSSVFNGGGLKGIFHQIGQRVAFGGDAPLTQRIYYFSALESGGLTFATPSPIPFRTRDKNIELDMTAGVMCSGSFSYRLTDPIKFYNTVCGNFADTYPKSRLMRQLKSEFLTSVQEALGQLADRGMRASQLPAHTQELCDILKSTWKEQRGLELVSVGVSLTVVQKDFQTVQELQQHGTLRDPTMAAATLVGAQSDAMGRAAANRGGTGFVAMAGESSSAGQAARPEDRIWVCICGRKNSGNYCEECGKKKPGASMSAPRF